MQIDDALESAALDSLLRQLSESAFDGIEPGGRGRREVEGPARVARQPGQHLGVLVGGIVVEHRMDRPTGRGCRAANKMRSRIASPGNVTQ